MKLAFALALPVCAFFWTIHAQAPLTTIATIDIAAWITTTCLALDWSHDHDRH